MPALSTGCQTRNDIMLRQHPKNQFLEPISKSVGCALRTDPQSLNGAIGAWDAPYENRNNGILR